MILIRKKDSDGEIIIYGPVIFLSPYQLCKASPTLLSSAEVFICLSWEYNKICHSKKVFLVENLNGSSLHKISQPHWRKMCDKLLGSL